MDADARSDGEGGALNDTIYALSSGAPPAAIAVVRISGGRAQAALEALAGRLPRPRVATLVTLREAGELLDEALVLRFPGPASATGEDLVELHLHGGRSVVAAVLAALGRIEGLREARPANSPGVRRTWPIDLAEAEGLADLLEAETAGQRRQALPLAGGALSRKVAEWQAQLLALSAEIEAALDFSDEDDVAPLSADFGARLTAFRGELASWLARPLAERLRDGLRVVIAGPPNVGKSSLFNALLGRDAAITSPLPGTTRDLIEAPVSFKGCPFLLIDTAGLRDAADEIEEIGIARAQASAAAADLILWLGAPEEAPAQALRLHAKSDLGPPSAEVDLCVSATTGENIDALIRLLMQHSAGILPVEGEVALNARHRALLAVCADALDEAETPDLLVVAEALRRGLAALDAITGKAGVEHMLDALFGRFCIGK